MHRTIVIRFMLAPGLCFACTHQLQGDLLVSPRSVVLDGPEASQQLLVSETRSGKRAVDVTRSVSYGVLNRQIATIDEGGVMQPRGAGRTEVQIRYASESVRIPVEVRGLDRPARISFEHEIVPILTKARCNSGGCHGKAEGQAGLKLSVFGFDPAADFDVLVKEGRGRRVSALAPERSLLLLKATSAVPHGGGRRIEKGDLRYRRFLRWISEGTRLVGDAAALTAIEIEPKERVLLSNETQQLRVTVIDVTGRRRCVTAEAEYESNSGIIADVDAEGFIRAGNVPGEASILVRYMGQVAVCRVTQPRPGVKFVRPGENNFVDRLVWDKLEGLGIVPSRQADDATFLRRVFLDTIGTLPTPREARLFLTSRAPEKRRRLIEQLLNRPEYADYWAMRWSDILRVDRAKVSAQGSVAMSRWLRDQFLHNRPYHEFVRDILTVQGDTQAEGPASLYKALDSPEVLSRSISQLFLGVRIECAQCHHHPFEKWSQQDYYALAGFFTGISRKNLPTGNQAILASPGSNLEHPRTGEIVSTRALGAPAADFTGVTDRRRLLADWMTSPDNPFFAQAIGNRLWAHYFGRGLVEPIDDLRATNPATNELLLTELAKHLRELNYDLKAFTQTLLNSRVYQLSSRAEESNATDHQNFSHARIKALPAEVLLDAICQSTQVPEKFNGWPLGYRAIQIWDNRLPSYFFRIFGRPVRASVCECERSNEPGIAQALHLMNSPEILSKIQSPDGKAARLAASEKSAEEIITELFLATLSRFPATDERELLLKAFAQPDRRNAAEDVLWTLLNSKEFLYNH